MAVIVKNIPYGDGRRTIRYLREPMPDWYLSRANHHASACQGSNPEMPADDHFEHAFLAILYSALAIESNANQAAEDVIPEKEFEDFEKGRKPYGKVGKLSAPISKWIHLFHKIGVSMKPTNALVVKAEDVVQARNKFVHYKPMESGAQFITDEKPHVDMIREGNQIHFTEEVYMPIIKMPDSKVVPSLVDKEVNSVRAQEHYLAVSNIISHWHESFEASHAQRKSGRGQ